MQGTERVSEWFNSLAALFSHLISFPGEARARGCPPQLNIARFTLRMSGGLNEKLETRNVGPRNWRKVKQVWTKESARKITVIRWRPGENRTKIATKAWNHFMSKTVPRDCEARMTKREINSRSFLFLWSVWLVSWVQKCRLTLTNERRLKERR